jgi:ribonuclease HI
MDPPRPSTIDMFVDGACLGNGKDGARAAWAWACASAGDQKITETHAESVPADQPQTNQYAELSAFAYAFLRLPPSKDQFVCIYSDSAYAINCISVWGPQWKANGWARKPGGRGKPLEHIGIIAPLVEKYLKEQVRLALFHIPAHPKAAEGRLYPASGNVLVDKLAQAKANETQELSVSQ